jgi:hypothetical protein
MRARSPFREVVIVNRIRQFQICILCALSVGLASFASAQSKGVKLITAQDMKPYLRFLGARELRGRSAPSVELDIASKYLAVEAARIGLQPLMPDGSYFQQVPVEVTTMSTTRSYLRVIGPTGESRFTFPQAFTSNVRAVSEWSAAGGIVFAGTALGGPKPAWDDALGIDLKGKFVVYLESQPAGAAGSSQAAGSAARTRILREKGAIGIITVIDRPREANLAAKRLDFDISERLRFLDVDTFNPPAVATAPASGAPAQPPAAAGPFYTVEVRHDTAAAILGISADELGRLFDAAAGNAAIAPRLLPRRSLDISVAFEQRTVSTPNVVAFLPGGDPKLKDEYVVIGSHHDHNPVREGRIFPGADDNASGSVAMLSIAKAMMVERPKRSVIFVWHTAEERGLVGAYYFVQHSPVPVEKISANLNLDMITRNDPNGIYLIGTTKLSTELDRSFRDANASIKLNFDYRYDDPAEPNRFFFRSDQYPYIRYGIPGVWVFCGTTPDYHQETDVEEKADYGKMEKVTRLTYLVAMDIGSKPGLLKLDVHPEVKTRGKENMRIVWQRPLAPATPR